MILEWRVGNISACFSVLINCESKFGIGGWMPLWVNWGVSLWLDFLMDPWCWLWLLGHPDSFLCILSQKLDLLRVVFVGSSTTIRRSLNWTKMLLYIFYILIKSVSYPSIIFMGYILLAVIYTSSHPILQGLPHLVPLLGVVAFWSGMVMIAVSSMIIAVVLWLVDTIILVSCRFLSCWVLGINLGL